MTEYVLKIETKEYDKITELLKVLPTRIKYSWEFSINEQNILYTNAIDYLMNIIESKRDELIEMGVKSNDITIWFYKPYIGECNIEFSPEEMKRLSNNKVSLCISCWEI